MKKKLTYLRFLQLSQALKDLPLFPQLIINLCAGFWHSDMQVIITDFAKMLPGVSERTVHRRLKQLIAKDMIWLETDQNDKRIKYIRATKRSEKYFYKLDECMRKAKISE
jgi:DNA-binding MarR family transcriptional regulator